ncbi:MAG: non-canonical purine NTP pyrophosphatase [Thaumarchaeota archaeon]|nr:non-canonical purine NTP pyrophosphatase [Nitrososphaerota archaeon]
MSEAWFATSNDHKYAEARFVLRRTDVVLRRLNTKGDEVQSDDPGRIASLAASQSHRLSRKPVFTEDTALFVPSLGGFPGTYASHAYSTLGMDRFLKLVPRDERRAVFVSAVAYCDSEHPPRVFIGRLEGNISRKESGSNGFGFDPVFAPSGSAKTLAQLTMAQKCEISHRAVALRKLAAWLRSRNS